MNFPWTRRSARPREADRPAVDDVTELLERAALAFDDLARKARQEALALDDLAGPSTRRAKTYLRQASEEAARLIARAKIFEARAGMARKGYLLFGPDEAEDGEFLSGWRPLISTCRDRGRIVYRR